MCVTCLGVAFLASLIDVLGGALALAIIVRALRSWIQVRLPFGLDDLIAGVTEPVLGPIRRVLPYAAGMDFSPFVALIAIQFARQLLLGVLPRVV